MARSLSRDSRRGQSAPQKKSGNGRGWANPFVAVDQSGNAVESSATCLRDVCIFFTGDFFLSFRLVGGEPGGDGINPQQSCFVEIDERFSDAWTICVK